MDVLKAGSNGAPALPESPEVAGDGLLPKRLQVRRVALLTWDYPPAPTGLGRAAAEIAGGLAEAGVAVTVFAMDRPGKTVDLASGAEVIGCADLLGPSRRWLRRRAIVGHLAAPAAFRMAVGALHRQRPFDLVEATNWYAPAGLLPASGPPFVLRNSTPAAATFERPASEEVASRRDRWDLAFANRLEAMTARRAAALISNTRHHARAIACRYRLPAAAEHSVVGLSIGDDRLAAGRRAPYPAPGPWQLCFIGRAERRKGFDETLGAFALLAQAAELANKPLPRLHLIGLAPGDLDRRWQALGLSPAFRAQVADYGRVSDEAAGRVLAACHAVLAPSRYESYGLVYREAAAFGRPLIASAEDPAAREFMAEAGSGVLAAATTAPAIAAATHAALADTHAAWRMREAGIAYAAGLTRKRLALATLTVYAKALRRHRRAGSAWHT